MKRDPEFAHYFKTDCYACFLPMRRSKHINFVITEYKQHWEYPSAGNILTGEAHGATAILCDACVAVSNPPLYVVEFQGKTIIMHHVGKLEKIRYFLWFDTSPDTGHPDCICSYCHQPIQEGEIPFRMLQKSLEARLCDECTAKFFKNELGDLSKLPTKLKT